MKPADEEKLRDLATTVIAATSADGSDGLDLEDIVVVAAGRRQLIRVVVDGDAGVSLDAAAAVSRALAAALDAADATHTSPLGEDPYTLEVTSPGIGRPLTEARHFRRARGRLVTVKMLDGSAVEGRVRRVVETDLELLTTAKDASLTVIPLDQIRRAKVEVEFGKMPPAHVALLDADGFVDPARAFDEVEADEVEEADLEEADLDEDFDDDPSDDDQSDDDQSDDDDLDGADETDETGTDADEDDESDDDPALESDITQNAAPGSTTPEPATKEGQL